MNTINNVANFNGQRPVIDPDDAVLLLIDHQSGLFQTVRDMEMTVLRDNATTLAKVASLAGDSRHHERILYGLFATVAVWDGRLGNRSSASAAGPH